jgi:hypothetical protein
MTQKQAVKLRQRLFSADNRLFFLTGGFYAVNS